jgi:hypothetical protein
MAVRWDDQVVTVEVLRDVSRRQAGGQVDA